MKKQFHTPLKDQITITEFVGFYHVDSSVFQKLTKQDTTACWQLFYVLHGEWRGIVNGQQVAIPENVFYLFPPDCVRILINTAHLHTEYGIVSFISNTANLYQIANMYIQAKPDERNLFKNIGELTQNNFEIIKDSDTFRGLRPKASTSDILLHRLKNHIESLLLSLYSHLESDYSSDIKTNTLNRDIQIVREIENYMLAHLEDSLTMADLVKHSFLSESKIKRIFKNVTGHGAIQHFTSLKIDYAMDLIQNGSHNFSDIADMLGFESLNYFSQVFKKKTGYTPTDFSKLHR